MRIDVNDYCEKCGNDYYETTDIVESDFKNNLEWEIFKIAYQNLNKLYCPICLKYIIDDKQKIKDYYNEYIQIKNGLNYQFGRYIKILEERDQKPLSKERIEDLWNRNVVKELQRAHDDFRNRVENVLQKL